MSVPVLEQRVLLSPLLLLCDSSSRGLRPSTFYCCLRLLSLSLPPSSFSPLCAPSLPLSLLSSLPPSLSLSPSPVLASPQSVRFRPRVRPSLRRDPAFLAAPSFPSRLPSSLPLSPLLLPFLSSLPALFPPSSLPGCSRGTTKLHFAISAEKVSESDELCSLGEWRENPKNGGARAAEKRGTVRSADTRIAQRAAHPRRFPARKTDRAMERRTRREGEREREPTASDDQAREMRERRERKGG